MSNKINLYLNIDCSEKERTATIDGNYYGWVALRDKFNQFRINISKKLIIPLEIKSIEFGGILTIYDANKNFSPITECVLKYNQSLEYKGHNIFYFHMEVSEKFKKSIFLFNKLGLNDFISSIDCLINHKGNYPVDISHMIEDWGGENLTDDIPENNFTSVAHLRLYRWE